MSSVTSRKLSWSEGERERSRERGKRGKKQKKKTVKCGIAGRRQGGAGAAASVCTC